MRLYLSPEAGESGGDTETTITIGGIEYDPSETITIGGKEYTLDEIQKWPGKGEELTKREQELETAAASLKPFLKALQDDPDQAAVEMQKLIDEARKTANKTGDAGDNKLVKQLEAQQDQIAKIMLDGTIKDMRNDSETYPYFKGNEEEVLKYCADHEIADLETGYNAWVGKNIKKLTSGDYRAVKNADATTLGRSGKAPAAKDAEWKPGESWANYLTRTGQMPKSA